MTGEISEIPKLGLGTIFSVVATGDSAKDWVPNGHSIGVNDCWKFSKPTDSLLICNRPQQFSADRLKIITESKPKDFYSHKSNWKEYFPLWKKVRLHTWSGTLQDWHRSDGPSAYSSNTSPLIAITLAYNLGAKDIILWGVDFRNHSMYNDNNPATKREVGVYLDVFAALKERGVNIYLGRMGSVFDSVLSLRIGDWIVRSDADLQDSRNDAYERLVP